MLTKIFVNRWSGVQVPHPAPENPNKSALFELRPERRKRTKRLEKRSVVPQKVPQSDFISEAKFSIRSVHEKRPPPPPDGSGDRGKTSWKITVGLLSVLAPAVGLNAADQELQRARRSIRATSRRSLIIRTTGNAPGSHHPGTHDWREGALGGLRPRSYDPQ